MIRFNTQLKGRIDLGSRRAVHITEGTYRPGHYFHLIRLDMRSLQARFMAPSESLKGIDQRLAQGRLSEQTDVGAALGAVKNIQSAGQDPLQEHVAQHPATVLVSDASNYPINEGHFVIQQGKKLPLPQGAEPIHGKHYVLTTRNGLIKFEVVDVDDAASVQQAEEGFFVAQIIAEGQPIQLLDTVPQTGRISIADFRGHIGQIFVEAAYSEMNSPERVDIHNELIEYLRSPERYKAILEKIVSGQSVTLSGRKKQLPLNRFTHTYWLESEAGDIYCLKTYLSADRAGVTFNDGSILLMEIAAAADLSIRNAFIGTNGKDTRIISLEQNHLVTIAAAKDGTSFGTHFDRPLPNFIAFTEC
ncbi:hypothetical protein ACFL5U_00820 [Candidatus Margulisiibacteriota bacterium]